MLFPAENIPSHIAPDSTQDTAAVPAGAESIDSQNTPALVNAIVAQVKESAVWKLLDANYKRSLARPRSRPEWEGQFEPVYSGSADLILPEKE